MTCSEIAVVRMFFKDSFFRHSIVNCAVLTAFPPQITLVFFAFWYVWKFDKNYFSVSGYIFIAITGLAKGTNISFTDEILQIVVI